MKTGPKLGADWEVFSTLTRSTDFAWLKPETIALRAGLGVEATREVLDRHLATGLIIEHSEHAGLYGEVETVRPVPREAAPQALRRAAPPGSCGTSVRHAAA